jgi:hypothetical protein
MESELIGTGAALRLDPTCLRRWHLKLAATLTDRQARVSVIINDYSAPSLPASVQLLLSLECMLTGRARPRLGDKVELVEFSRYHAAGQSDLVVDLSSSQEAVLGTRSLRPLYDGVACEAAVFAALLAGRSPIIEIERQPDRQILARGRPSLEGARTLNDCHDIIAASVSDLLLSAICSTASPLAAEEEYSEIRLRSTQVPEYMLTTLRTLALGRIYRLCCYSPHWRVGWRFVSGQDVWDRMDLGGVSWNTIANPGLRFLADPFPMVWQGATYVFVEDFDHRQGKGIISVVPFDSGGPSAGPLPVLEEPWHLSYPFVFEDGNNIWMIPESCESRQISLYRAANFPTGWVKEATLLKDISAGDTTIVRHLGRLWMFTTILNAGRSTDSLSIFTADRLFGPWLPHPRNPVLLDAAAARSGGNIILRNGKLWRPVQDCRGRYGGALGLAEITRLDDTDYHQIVRKVLHPGAEWPGRRLHTLNRSGRLECIDGSANLMRATRYLP